MKFQDVMLALKGKMQSHPTRGAWIEIPGACPPLQAVRVAPHTGCVD